MPSSTQRTTRRATPVPTAPPIDDKFAPNAWLAGGVGGLEELTVPSGQLCLVRRPGLEGLIKSGVLRNIDSLSSIVNKQHIKKVRGKGGVESQEVDTASLLNDPESLEKILDTVDKVVAHIVVKPEVFLPPNDVTLRKPRVVYTDMIDLTDKMFLFNYAVGGTRDLESFRRGLDESVGGVEAS